MTDKPKTTNPYHETLRRMMTEWVAAFGPSISEFSKVEKSLAKFQELLDEESDHAMLRRAFCHIYKFYDGETLKVAVADINRRILDETNNQMQEKS